MNAPQFSRPASWLRMILLAGGALSAISAAAGELPRGATVAQGKVRIAADANRMTIRQTSRKAIVNWTDFSIGRDQSVSIRQPSRSSAILNRVTGSTPSTIAGRLDANGQVYLVNPNGVAITRSGVVRTGAFVASTLGTTDADFAAGRPVFAGSGASAAVVNQGVIEIGRGGYAALLGGRVDNFGTLSVPLGKVGLGAGESVALDLSGDGFLRVAVPSRDAGDGALIDSSGRIAADGGRVEIRAATARRAARQAVNLSGVVEARSVSGRNGAIRLGGGAGGEVRVSGRLDASAPRAAAAKAPRQGGEITLTGAALMLTGATLDASGSEGGGRIRIGGDWRGGGVLPRAETTFVDGASLIRADARRAGDGGSVVVWADGGTDFRGRISARGGAGAGDGGRAEVSGKRRLSFAGRVDLSAPAGGFGTLLLDPYNVFIEDGEDAGFGVDGDELFGPFGPNSVLNAATLEGLLARADVLVQTTGEGAQAGNITVGAPLNWGGAAAGGGTLTLSADNNIVIAQPIAAPFGALDLFAGGRIATPLVWVDSAGARRTGGDGAINVGAFFLGSGEWVQRTATLPAFSARDFRVAVDLAEGGATFLRAAGGAGTAASPYWVADVYGLQGIGSSPALLARDWALAGPIAAGGTAGWNASSEGASGFAPIGDLAAPFVGALDGGGFAIRGLVQDGGFGETDSVGVFGAIGAGGSVANLRLENVAISGTGFDALPVGGLAGRNDGTIDRAFVSGSVSGFAFGSDGGQDLLRVGGLVGVNRGAIRRSRAEATVAAATDGFFSAPNAVLAGGLAGQSNGAISDSYATGDVTAASANSGKTAGGLVGLVGGTGSLLRVFARGDVTADAAARPVNGGLVGENRGRIVQAYATGRVSQGDNAAASPGPIGGLVGLNSGAIAQTYATGRVLGGAAGGGGLVGSTTEEAPITASYWDIQTTGQPRSAGGQGVGLTTAAFQNLDAFVAQASAAGWNFRTAWAPPSAGFYPELYALTPVASLDIADARRFYGAPDGALTARRFGGPDSYVFGPQPDSLDTDATLSTAATRSSDAGVYGISAPDAATSAQGVAYRLVVLEGGALTVAPAPLTVAVDDAARLYGRENPGFSARYSGFVLGQDASVLDGALRFDTRATAASDVGAYAVAAEGLASGNYAISYRSGALAVTPAPLTISANDLRKPFGATLVFTGTEFTARGLVNGDSVRSVRLESRGAPAAAPVEGSPYAIRASDATGAGPGAGLSNYDIAYAPGALTVTPAPTPPPTRPRDTATAAELPPPAFARMTPELTLVVDEALGPGGGGPTLGVGAPARNDAQAMLAFVEDASRDLEAAAARCETGARAFDGRLACLREALALYGARLDSRVLDLPAPLRRVTAVIEQAARRIETARSTAAQRMQAARTPEEAQAIAQAAVGEARAAIGEAVAEVRKAIELIRAEEPQVARLQADQGAAIAAALQTVDGGLERAIGL